MCCDGMGQGKNSGSETQCWPLNLEMDRVECGEATHTHQMGPHPPIRTYLLSMLMGTCIHTHPYPFTAALYTVDAIMSEVR